MTSVDEGTFRHAMGRLGTGVTVVTTLTDGLDHAMTANAVTSVSLDPPLLLVCVEQDARFHDAVLEAGRFGVNILTAGQRSVAQWLATPGRPLPGQLDGVPHHAGPQTGCALLDEALATLECRVVDSHVAGDHTIVVGEVLGIDLTSSDDAALTYYRGAYGSLA